MDVIKLKKAEIFVKYCGGCNPTFDRKQVVSEIEKCFGIKIEPYKEDYIPDIVLIVNGCKSECIDISRYKSKYKTILINDEVQISDVIAAIKTLMDS